MIEHYIVVAPKKPGFSLPPIGAGTGDGAHVRNQHDYNGYLNDFPYNEGDFLTFASAHVQSLAQIHYIAKLETSFDKVVWDRYGGPKLMHMVQCEAPRGGVSLTPWVRWDNRNGYRLLTATEYDEYIKENHDNIRDSCLKLAGYPTE